MASKPDKTILEASMGRHMRGEERSLSCPSALTDKERRVFLDLPDVDMETANIRAVTALSCAALISCQEPEQPRTRGNNTSEEQILDS
ncbi:hypothetical protein BOTCAL_0286g00130 [Botryotinia calthae]|uniref:Uncharacterized protein n=1 Tax=Botryotinia calthae TaxID=38488 RepID=A0A4Y8CXU2_9HELO|nr:hypothetical protein BOTCAL_0286g00130 [Botryotinia calthae]